MFGQLGLPAWPVSATEYRNSKFVLREDNHAAVVFVVTAGGPAVSPSGHACHEAVSSGEDEQTCQPLVFPTTSNQPHLPTVTTAPV